MGYVLAGMVPMYIVSFLLQSNMRLVHLVLNQLRLGTLVLNQTNPATDDPTYITPSSDIF